MSYYRKKPVIIEAVRYEGVLDGELALFIKEAGYAMRDNIFTIDTLEGAMRVKKGDYIIKGIKSEFYPCANEIFELTYEKASDD